MPAGMATAPAMSVANSEIETELKTTWYRAGSKAVIKSTAAENESAKKLIARRLLGGYFAENGVTGKPRTDADTFVSL